MSDTLKPCPFCGGEAAMEAEYSEVCTLIGCDKCDFTIQAEGQQEAIAAWNTRHERTDAVESALDLLNEINARGGFPEYNDYSELHDAISSCGSKVIDHE